MNPDTLALLSILSTIGVFAIVGASRAILGRVRYRQAVGRRTRRYLDRNA